MSEQMVNMINDMLNEEKWTRATLNNYTINNFKELDELIEKIQADDSQDEVKALCDDHLAHTKNSIIALYISGIISLSKQLIDDSNLIMLINIFSDNHKWNIVEYLSKRMLQFGENKYALRTLAECYANENEPDKVFEVWERLIKVDYEEADIVRQLAERKEKEGKIDEAVDFYKKAIHRYVNKKLYNNVKEIWHKLIQYTPEDMDFFFHVESKIAKLLGSERASMLLADLYPHFKDKEDWNTAIEVLKKMLDYDSKNDWARKEIVDVFRRRHAGHSQLEEYIRLSNLSQSWRNVHDAISDFEKHISFDEGNFVYHRAWGIGRIKSIDDDEIVIDFARKRNHKMSLRMAVNALNSLSRDHIWVLKTILKKEKLHEKVKKDIPWALKVVIRSHDNTADIKTIKQELVPSILTQGEWSSWSVEARNILKTDPAFGNFPDKADHFVVRDKPISYEEKMFNSFKAEKNFFSRITTILEYIQNAEPDTDYFGEMFAYFTGFLKSSSAVNEYVIASFLLVKRIVSIYPFLNPGITFDFKELFEQIDNVETVFAKLDDADIRRDFLSHVKRHIKNWPDVYVSLFPMHLGRDIVDALVEAGHEEKLLAMTRDIIDRYRDHREAFVWVAKNVLTPSVLEKLEISYEKILIYLIHLLDITYRETDNHRDVSLNKKINKQIQTYLFKDGKLEEYIMASDEESTLRLYTLIEDVKNLDPSIRIELKHKIMERYPDFKFYGEQRAETVSRGFIVTRSSYDSKQAQLQHIIDVEIPENSKEISVALQHGDLRENAEYKAAKEKQELLNSTAGRLQEELDRAQIFEHSSVDTSRISFGTVVELTNKDTGAKEQYTILGPWESDPSKRIISYLSPLGNELYNKKTGDDLSFVINERTYNYHVESVQSAKF